MFQGEREILSNPAPKAGVASFWACFITRPTLPLML